MRPATVTYGLILLVLAIASCNKAPDGVISESKMAHLIADLNKAEFYIESHSSDFPTDSTRMALKQSIYAKHGVSQELYDHSLEWYAHNMDVYTDVCDRAMRQLEDEKKSLTKRMAHEPQLSRGLEPSQPTYASHGDTADVWVGRRSWVLTAGMRHGTLRWDQQPDSEHRPGDRYMLRILIKGNSSGMTATLAADYSDGSTTTTTRPLSTSDWNMVLLQTDTLRQLRRIYGYISYNMQPQTMAMLDSVALVRTHLDRNSYGIIGTQVTVDRHGNAAKSGQDAGHRVDAAADAHVLRDRADDQARATGSRITPGRRPVAHREKRAEK